MHDNAHSKRTSFWKSLIATVAVIMLGTSCNTEARVTREVAEATIPYLLEAVGIPPAAASADGVEPGITAEEAQATNIARRDAIVHMLYTDDGQRQMVNWARNGIFPPRLMTDPITQNAVFVPSNLYLYGWLSIPLLAANPQMQNVNGIMQNMFANIQAAPMALFAAQEMRNAYIGALFPPGPGTFSSYATHISRLGYHILNGNLVDICSALISGNALQNQGLVEVQGIINRLRQYQNIDNQLAYILFVLDICDTVDQIKNILDQVLGVPQAQIRNTEIDNSVNNEIHNEYNHRPVSATSIVNNQRRIGDCVETLYRHLINIAIQNNMDVARAISRREYDIGHLPIQLRQNYYTVLYNGHIHNNVVTVPRTHSEAGRTRLDHHEGWKNTLTSSLFVVILGNNFANMPQAQITAVTNHTATHGNQIDQIASIIANGVVTRATLVPIIRTDQTINVNTANGIADNIIALTRSITTIISNATMADIVGVLRGVSPANMGQSNLGIHAAAGAGYQTPLLVPVIQTSQGIPHDNGTNQQANATAIQNALNALDGRCNAGNERFIVNVTDDPGVIAAQVNLPNGINIVIEIADKLWNRRIKVGIWTDRHAEIVSIN